jgi:hypothetical protein
MKKLLTGIFLSASVSIHAQAPVLYIQIVSHNEPSDNMQLPLNYTRAKANMLQMASIVNTKNAKWNVQTSDGFVFGARQDQASTSTNIFSTLAGPPYNDNIEIDPRSKNFPGRNIADQWYLLDSLGANPTTHLGGCIYAVSSPYTMADIDWLQYRDTIHGLVTPGAWQCSILTGAGSLPAHTNDLSDFGCFKPDTTTNFYQHNPNKNLWCMGVGCAPVLDSLDDEQAIIDLIQGQVDSIQNGLWPANKFYVTRIMTNQREYGPLFFQKIARVIDSLNLIPSTQLKWATIGESFTAFQTWELSSGLDHSQWLCGETLNSVAEAEKNSMHVYPNPASGILNIDLGSTKIKEIQIIDMMGNCVKKESLDAISSAYQLDISDLAPGLYFASEESSNGQRFNSKFLKE